MIKKKNTDPFPIFLRTRKYAKIRNSYKILEAIIHRYSSKILQLYAKNQEFMQKFRSRKKKREVEILDKKTSTLAVFSYAMSEQIENSECFYYHTKQITLWYCEALCNSPFKRQYCKLTVPYRRTES